MTLYKHQTEAIAKANPVLDKEGGFALFMEMGTGKTLTAIELSHKSKKVCIIAPKSLMPVWEAELKKFSTAAYYSLRWDANKSASQRWQSQFISMIASDAPFYFIVNVEAFSIPNKKFIEAMSYFITKQAFLIVDESSKIKNPKASRSKNIAKTSQFFRYRIILTGTEITNSPLDFYQQLEIVKKNCLGYSTFYKFCLRYAIMEERRLSGGRSFSQVIGYRALDELKAKVEPYCFSVKKADCLDLPEKIYEEVYAELSSDETKAYKDLKRDLMTVLHDETIALSSKTALFMKLRQVCGGGIMRDAFMRDAWYDQFPESGKMVALLDDLENHDEQAIIWSAFTGELLRIFYVLKKANYTASFFYGALSGEERQESIKAFTSGASRFLVANPQCGAYGLNLQNCHLHYFYSRTLSPEENLQAEDRSHRIGQKSPCVYKSIICKNTVDERILILLDAKKQMRSDFWAGKYANTLSEQEELEYLLK